MKLSQLEKRIQKTLSISKDIIQKAESRGNKDQRAVKQMSEAWALYKSNPSRVSWGDLSRDRGTDTFNWYIACSKLASPAENAFQKKKKKKKKIGNEIGISFSHAIKNRLSK